MQQQEINNLYGNKIRVRVCGLCWRDDKLLMVNHSGLANNDLWLPPGGGIEYNETAADALIREFKEETGITIKIGQFRFACEFISSPLHAIELFFDAIYETGEVITGADPELKETQIIKAISWMTPQHIKKLPVSQRHGIFKVCPEPKELHNLTGYWQI